MRYKHPWSPQSNALSVLFLPCFESGTSFFGKRMQLVFGEVVSLAYLGERLFTSQFLGAQQAAGRLPCGISPYLAESFACFGEQSVVEAASGFQVGTQGLFRAPIHPEGQFQEQRSGLRSFHVLLCLFFSNRVF
jgi:hypothetical protein